MRRILRQGRSVDLAIGSSLNRFDCEGTPMKCIVFACVLAGATPAAFAQDTICGGLDALLRDAVQPAPFRRFEIDERTGRELPDIVRPAGMGSAYECRVKRGDARDLFECTWSLDSSAIAQGALSMIDRIGNCLTPRGWSSAPPWTAPAARSAVAAAASVAPVVITSSRRGSLRAASRRHRASLRSWCFQRLRAGRSRSTCCRCARTARARRR